MSITWTERKVKVKDLKAYERNPRKLSEADYDRLKKSLVENGYHTRVLVTKDLRIIGGHQRKRVLQDLGIKEVAVLFPDRELTPEEFRRLLIQDNLSFGQWDFDILSADFDIEELTGFGMSETLLGLGGDNEPEEDPQGAADEEDSRVVPCPKCGHEFSILVEKKKGKKK